MIRYNARTKDYTLTMSDGSELSGFDSVSSAYKANQSLSSISWDLEAPPTGLYEAFKHPSQDWAFIDRLGVIHATFQTEEAAQNHALKIK